jgi:hypothetical protein
VTWNCKTVNEVTKWHYRMSSFLLFSQRYLRCYTQPKPCFSNVLFVLMFFNDYDFVITKTGGMFWSILQSYCQTLQQYNDHTWWGKLVIVVVVPPTMRPSSFGFVELRGTPEVLTNILITKSTVYILSINI